MVLGQMAIYMQGNEHMTSMMCENAKWQNFRRQFGSVYQRKDPVVSLLGIYSSELKMYIHTKLYMLLVTTASFVTVQTLKATKVNKQIVVHSYNGDYTQL